MTILILQTATYTPYRIAFLTTDSSFDNGLDLFMDVYFLTDIVINFFTAYNEPITDVLVTDPVKIVRFYLKTDFILDVVASFPFSILDSSFNFSGSGSG